MWVGLVLWGILELYFSSANEIYRLYLFILLYRFVICVLMSYSFAENIFVFPREQVILGSGSWSISLWGEPLSYRWCMFLLNGKRYYEMIGLYYSDYSNITVEMFMHCSSSTNSIRFYLFCLSELIEGPEWVLFCHRASDLWVCLIITARLLVNFSFSSNSYFLTFISTPHTKRA